MRRVGRDSPHDLEDYSGREGSRWAEGPPWRFLSRSLVSMLISASLSLGRRNAGAASALTSGDRNKLHERQRQGDTQDCLLRVTGAAAEETLQEGYSCSSASEEKIISETLDALVLGSKHLCIKHQALVLAAWTSVMLGRPGFDTTDEKQDRRHWGQTTSQAEAVRWSQQKHRGPSFPGRARSSQFDQKMHLHVQETKSALSWLNSEPHLDTSPSVSETVLEQESSGSAQTRGPPDSLYFSCVHGAQKTWGDMLTRDATSAKPLPQSKGDAGTAPGSGD